MKAVQPKFIPHCEICKLKPYHRNPRKNDDAVEAVVASIEAYGFINPIVVDEEYRICAGHTRFKAATQMGMGTVPVIVAAQLVGDKFSGYNIADNQTGNLAEWDDVELAGIIQELQNHDFEIDSLGFDAKEFNEIMAQVDQYGENITVPYGDKPPFSQMTFTIADKQKLVVERAIAVAHDLGPYGETGNENSNGNALARICEGFLGSIS